MSNGNPSYEPNEQGNSTEKVGFFKELKRRKVFRVAATYLVVGWLIVQIANATFGDFGIPVWAFRFVVLMLMLGFPVAVILAWAFELTPDGIRTTHAVREDSEATDSGEKQTRKRNRFALLFAAAVPTLIFASLALFFYIKYENPTSGPVDELVDPISIAVLPLANMSPNEENAYFAGGVHEDILTNLSRIKDLKVISRTSTLPYLDEKRNLKEIGKELGVRYLVEGSVRRQSDQVRVTVQLIDAVTDEHLWAENYDRQLKDIFSIQSEIAKEIAHQLHATISPAASALIDRTPTDNLDAYEYLVRGRDKLFFIESAESAILDFQKALEIDPDLAEGPEWMAYYYVLQAMRNFISSSEAVPKVEQWLEYAENLGSKTELFYLVRGFLDMLFRGNIEQAAKDILRAMEMNPSNSWAHYCWSGFYMAIGMEDKAIDWLKRAIELDPHNEFYRWQLSEWYRVTNQYEASIRQCEIILDANPDNSEAIRVLGMVYTHMGRIQEGIKYAKRALEMQDGQGWSAINLASIYGLAGEEEKARKLLTNMQSGDFDIYIPGYAYAFIYAGLGEFDPAFTWLEKSFVDKDYWIFMLNRDPFYRPLANDPRFQEFESRLQSMIADALELDFQEGDVPLK